MKSLALIGGSGMTCLPGLEAQRTVYVDTPFDTNAVHVTHGRFCGQDLAFLARHGPQHRIPPHKINYRANLWGLKQVGVKRVVAVAAVGGIHADMKPGRIVFPDQIIDYTHGRCNTYFEDDLEAVTHVDFTRPYSAAMQASLIEAANEAGLAFSPNGTYGCTQGPRLETAAEIKRMQRDGCDIVGMTGMPEAVLARELGLEYACCAVVVNWAAGKAEAEITMEDIRHHMHKGMQDVIRLLRRFVAQ